MRSFPAMLAVILFAMLAAVLAARVFAPAAMGSADDQVRMAVLVGWLAMLMGSMVLVGNIRIGHALRSLLIWAGIGLFLIAIYTLREDFGELYGRMMGEIRPYAPATLEAEIDDEVTPVSGSAASVRRSMDGHFYAEAQVNGSRVRFLVDTGASTVALTQADARRAGIDVDDLRYTVQVSTANGVTAGAPVRLDRVSVGGVRLDNVDAIVIAGDALSISLLGMSFLGRLSRYEATPNSLILRR